MGGRNVGGGEVWGHDIRGVTWGGVGHDVGVTWGVTGGDVGVTWGGVGA